MIKAAITVLGIDLGKNSCSAAGLDASGAIVFRRRATREGVLKLIASLPPCSVAMEACCGAHFRGRAALAHGHEVRLMPPEYVQPSRAHPNVVVVALAAKLARIEHRSNGERKYYLSNLPADTSLTRLAGAIKARWICEQAHQQLKEELGLDHFEGRSWKGLHRHALRTMIAYAFLQSRRLNQAKREKKNPRSATTANPACDPGSHHNHARTPPSDAMSTLSMLAHS